MGGRGADSSFPAPSLEDPNTFRMGLVKLWLGGGLRLILGAGAGCGAAAAVAGCASELLFNPTPRICATSPILRLVFFLPSDYS